MLKLGADPNFTDKEGRSALHHAVDISDKGADSSFEMEALLLRHKANIDLIDSLGRTPLHYAFVEMNRLG